MHVDTEQEQIDKINRLCRLLEKAARQYDYLNKLCFAIPGIICIGVVALSYDILIPMTQSDPDKAMAIYFLGGFLLPVTVGFLLDHVLFKWHKKRLEQITADHE